MTAAKSPQTNVSNKKALAGLGTSRETLIALFLLAFPISMFFIGRSWYDETYYNAEDGLGYYLGLVGGLMMLFAYCYSLRKHVKVLRFLGILGQWLRIHIWFGVIGPFLIIPHTTFRFDSDNGTIAFIAMSLVFLSGVTGRFLYSRVHFGLDGRRAQLKEIAQLLGLDGQDQESVLSRIPKVKEKLQEYEKAVITTKYGVLPAFYALFMARIKGYSTYFYIRRNLRRYLLPFAKQQRWTRADLIVAERQVRAMLKEYISTLITVSMFRSYDQLFVLWRMVHVPLLYLLFISGVIHVLYVHMY